MRNINRIVCHYSATYDDQDLDVHDMRKMHLKRGFNDVGYHWVIKLDGTLQEGRPEDRMGAHVKGFNRDSIGICCIGGLKRKYGVNKGIDTRTKEQKETLVALIHTLLEAYPDAEVCGHKDLTATQCPAYDVRKWWNQYALRTPVKAPTEPSPKPQVPEWLKTLYGRLRGNSKNV